MSAYALPGLFPPIDDAPALSWTTATSTLTTATTAAAVTAGDGSYTSVGNGNDLHARDETASATRPTSVASAYEHEVASTGTFSSSTTATTSSSFGNLECQQQQQRKSPLCDIATMDSHLPPLKSLEDEEEEDTERNNDGRSSTMLGIAVKEAKIDPVRLVQFLTGKTTTTTSSHSTASKTLRRKGSKERMGGIGSPQGSPVNRKTILQFGGDTSAGGDRNNNNNNNNNSTSSTSTSNNAVQSSTPHDEAIEFELSISFNGRKYTAKRTMQCIIRLRDDLIQEMNHRKQWLTTRQKVTEEALSCPDISSTHSTTWNGSDCFLLSSDCMPSNVDDIQMVHIPEIPPLTFITGEDHDRSHGHSMAGGFVGRGFTMLHAMVTSYVPVMERWLKNVMTIVPQDSECLMNFLWEPTSTTSEFGSILETNKCCSTSMGSIKEIDSEDDS